MSTIRHKSIASTVKLADLRHNSDLTSLKTFTGGTAQINQHESDHCSGILI